MKHKLLVIGLMSLGTVPAVWASGYHFGTQSASNQGVANAGAAAVFDPSALFYNPAAATQLPGTQLATVLNVVVPQGDFSNNNSVVSTPSGSVTVSTGSQPTGNFGNTKFVPHLYLSHQVNDRLYLGFSSFVPFGTSTEYANDWPGRYAITHSELKTMTFNPSLAYKLNDTVSLGAGFSAQRIQGKLVRRVNYGAAGLAVAANPNIPSQAKAPVGNALASMFGNGDYDGRTAVDGDDWGYGFNLGVLLKLDAHTRMGLAYRSGISHRLEGDVDWDVPQNIGSAITSRLTPILGGAAAGQFGAGAQANLNALYVDSAASLGVRTPESVDLNFFHQINEQWAVMADATWTRHSRFKELRVDFASNVPDSITPQHWRDTWRVALGGTYRYSDRWLFKAGMAYDQSPVTDATRTPSIPDNNRTWLSMGANYRWTDRASLDLAYTYVRVQDAPLHFYDNGGGETPCACSYTTVNGQAKLHSHIVGVQLNYAF